MSSKSTFRLAVRVDASSAIGTGHVFRCLALTDEMRRMGSEIVYVCAEAPGHPRDLLIDKGYRVHVIAPDLSLESDAAAMRSVLALDGPFDWLLVDHYKLNADWERAAAGIASRIAAIDDLADRHHDVDLLIDSSHDASQAGLYENLVPLDAQLALGSEYVLLRREFFETPPPERDFGAVRRILVTLGGNDPVNATGLTLEALDDPAFSSVQIDLTLGVSNPRLEAHMSKARAMANVTVHVQSPRMAELMAKADICLGAGGMTSWERCYMGLPSLILVIADNQREFAAKMEKMGCARSLGWSEKISKADLRSAILEAIRDTAWREKTSRTGQSRVDGQGVFRIIDRLQNPCVQGKTPEAMFPCP